MAGLTLPLKGSDRRRTKGFGSGREGRGLRCLRLLLLLLICVRSMWAAGPLKVPVVSNLPKGGKAQRALKGPSKSTPLGA